jgi:hypothetical protein
VQTSNNIVAKMKDWHTAAANNQVRNPMLAGTPQGKSFKHEGEPTFETVLDTFNAHFEELSALDQSPFDNDPTRGDVRVDIPQGKFGVHGRAVDKSLSKTEDGFDIRVRERSRDMLSRTTYAGNWFEAYDTTFSLNEKTKVLTVKEFACDVSNTWSSHTQTNIFRLDLEAGILLPGSGQPDSQPDQRRILQSGGPILLEPSGPRSGLPQAASPRLDAGHFSPAGDPTKPLLA